MTRPGLWGALGCPLSTEPTRRGLRDHLPAHQERTLAPVRATDGAHFQMNRRKNSYSVNNHKVLPGTMAGEGSRAVSTGLEKPRPPRTPSLAGLPSRCLPGPPAAGHGGHGGHGRVGAGSAGKARQGEAEGLRPIPGGPRCVGLTPRRPCTVPQTDQWPLWSPERISQLLLPSPLASCSPEGPGPCRAPLPRAPPALSSSG